MSQDDAGSPQFAAAAPAAPVTPAAAPEASAPPVSRAYVLGILLSVYIFNFIDRQIVSILQEPIKAEFGLKDWQLGLMTGTAFALFYVTLGLPIARLADKTNRVTIISISLAIWSGFTAFFGLAQNYAQLLLMRIGVGIGEAGCSPPSHSLISDYFPPNKRATALAVYALGIPLGSTIGIWSGAYLFKLLDDWRMAFIVVGLVGLAFAVVVKLTLPEPPRGVFDTKRKAELPPLMEVVRALSRKPSFWCLSLAGAFASLVSYSLFPWIPSYFVRVHYVGVPVPEAIAAIALPFGLIVGIAGSLGTTLGGRLADRFAAKDLRAYCYVPALASAACVPLFWLAFLMPTVSTSWLALILPFMLTTVWYGPLFATIQNLVAPGMRAMASAVMLLVVNLIGLGLGPVIAGAISDAMAAEFGAESVRYALLAMVTFFFVAAGLFFAAGRTIRKDWEA